VESSDSNKTQKLTIMIVGSICIAGNLLLTYFNSADGPKLPAEIPQFSTDGQATYWQNPNLSWYQKLFCRGFQSSSICSHAFIHPSPELVAREGGSVSGPQKGVVASTVATSRGRTLGENVKVDIR